MYEPTRAAPYTHKPVFKSIPLPNQLTYTPKKRWYELFKARKG